MQANSTRPKKKMKAGDQQTLFGNRAFDPRQDCDVCKGKGCGSVVHRAHHKLCCNNGRTRGIVSAVTLESMQEDKRLKEHFAAPLSEGERFSWKHAAKEAQAAFFAPREATVKQSKISAVTTAATTTVMDTSSGTATATDFCKAVTAKVNNPSFLNEHKDSRAPLAMLAFAGTVAEAIVRNKHNNVLNHFDGLTMTVPATDKDAIVPPQCDSIVGQKLLHVGWSQMFGLQLNCPRCEKGVLVDDRTNFSKNKILFPIFETEGPPLWCMVQSMVCRCCKARLHANADEVLCKVPACARAACPVETKHALPSENSHIGKGATAVFDLLMPTCGNGDLCSRLLCDSINRSHMERVTCCCSCHKTHRSAGATSAAATEPCINKDGQHVKARPPLGDGIRDTYDSACSNQNNPWKMSDHERHTGEIQSVGCQLVFAQDHTHEVTKNCFEKKSLGVNALWDVSTETGETAAAILAPTTKTRHFAHAATAVVEKEQLRPVCCLQRHVAVQEFVLGEAV